MLNEPITSSQIFALLEGTWRGEGRGGFPTVNSFDYRETLVFTRRDEKTLAYEQRTQRRSEGQSEYIPSHWENGFIRILENGELELANVQSNGRSEVLIGNAETSDAMTRIHFISKAFMNDARMISTARTFELQDDILHYEVTMHTTAVDRPAKHLGITLQRIR